MLGSRTRTPDATHRPSGRRRTSTMVAFVLAAVAAAVIAAPTASAHGPGTNGCTGVPDSGLTFNFHAACDRHDLCYDQLWYGKGRAGRLGCDNLWSREMKDSCRARYPNRYDPRRGSCFTVADQYYAVVRVIGGPWFNNPRLN